MQFGKRKKNTSLRSQRVQPAGQAQSESGKQQKSPEPESAQKPEAPFSPTTPAREEMPQWSKGSDSDSTERLLAALQNFHDQVKLAAEGAPQDMWSDTCMDQLISAVELALEEGWPDVVDVLTETGRVLQTYEEAGRGLECVSFLSDSYDIMSQMVGDLMVGGEVRPNALKRWNKRYQQALGEVAAAGLTLVQDEDSDESGAASSEKGRRAPSGASENAGSSRKEESKRTSAHGDAQAGAPRNGGTPKAAAGESPFDLSPAEEEKHAPSSPQGQRGMSGLAELPGLEELDDSTAGQTNKEEADSPPADLDFGASPFDLAGWTLDDQDTADVKPPRFPFDEEDDDAKPDEPVSGNGSKSPRRTTAETGNTADDDMAFMLDSWCEALVQLETGVQDKQEEYLGDAEESVNLLEGLARQNERRHAVEACQTCRELLSLISPGERPAERLIELAYAFCDAYAGAETPGSSALADWTADCRQFLKEAREPAPKPVEPTPPVVLDHVRVAWEPLSRETRAEETEAEPMPDVDPEPEPAAGVEAELEDPLAEAERLAEAAAEALPESTGAAKAAPAGAKDIAERMRELPPVYIEAAVRTAMATRDAGSPEQLLGVAMQAIARGEGESAKLLALRAAAMLAQAEAQQAETQLGEAENKLEQGVRAIEEARQEVTDAEYRVGSVESSVSEGESVLEERTQESTRIVEKVTGLEERISGLDAQIKALQEQREQEAQVLSQSQAELENAREREREQQQYIEELEASKKAAREQLEEARQRVKDLQQRRTEVENAMERAREALERRRSSMKDIEDTIAQVKNKEGGASVNTGDLLF